MQATRALKRALQWLTTQATGIEWAKPNVEYSVSKYTNLAAKAHSAVITGNPHATQRTDGTVDPMHVSGVIYTKSQTPLTSFHAYTDGLVKFSKNRYEDVLVPSDSQISSSQSAQATPSLTWRVENNVPEYWDGAQWVAAQYSHERGKWMYYYGNQWHVYS